MFETPIQEVAGVLTGPWRGPKQMLAAQEYGGHASIHDDATAQKLGVRVPADLSIVSLSALPGQRFTTPGIAAVISDFEEAGATASRLLLDLISGAPPPAAPRLLPTLFDPAGSLAPPRAGGP